MALRFRALVVGLLWCAVSNGSATAPVTVGAHAESLECKPRVKYVCDANGCERETENFQHAERFGVDLASGQLLVCLWTSCYSGRGTVLQSGDGAATTVIGRLASEGDPKMYPPRVVSITVGRERDFVAVQDYVGSGLVFDQGHCRHR